MAGPYEPPNPWDLVLTELRSVSARIDKLVTTDMFQAEQRRVDDHLQRLGRELGDEVKHREAADQREASSREAFVRGYREDQKGAEKEKRENRGRWYLALVGLVATPFLSQIVQQLIFGGR